MHLEEDARFWLGRDDPTEVFVVLSVVKLDESSIDGVVGREAGGDVVRDAEEVVVDPAEVAEEGGWIRIAFGGGVEFGGDGGGEDFDEFVAVMFDRSSFGLHRPTDKQERERKNGSDEGSSALG
jgi:hypothetical protein